MGGEITLETIKNRKCMICGDSHKSIASVRQGQMHIATVTVCCNCGFTCTFSHSASEYARFLEGGDYEFHTEICSDEHCSGSQNCPKIKKGRSY